jgi:proline-specific peptidase
MKPSVVLFFSSVLFFSCISENRLSPGEHSAHINGLQIHYEIAGHGPVIIVQGPNWGFGSAFYRQSLTPLERDFTVVYYDPRGNGHSESPAEPATVDVGHAVDDLEGLRVHLGLQSFSLLGHSQGGYIALNYALKHPNRVSRMILASALIGDDEVADDLRRTLPLLAEKKDLAHAVFTFQKQAEVDDDDEWNEYFAGILPLYFYDPSNVAKLQTMKLNRLKLTTWKSAWANSRAFAVRDRLHRISVPVLAVYGRHDFIATPVQGEILHKGIPDSRLVILEKSGHMLWLEEPDVFFEEVRTFLLDGERNSR